MMHMQDQSNSSLPYSFQQGLGQARPNKKLSQRGKNFQELKICGHGTILALTFFAAFRNFRISLCSQIVDKLRLTRYYKGKSNTRQGGATMTAVIYARYSSDSQREASIEGQLRVQFTASNRFRAKRSSFQTRTTSKIFFPLSLIIR